MEKLKERIADQLGWGETAELSLAVLLGAMRGRLGKIATPKGSTHQDLADMVRLAAEEIAQEVGAIVEWEARDRVLVFRHLTEGDPLRAATYHEGVRRRVITDHALPIITRHGRDYVIAQPGSRRVNQSKSGRKASGRLIRCCCM